MHRPAPSCGHRPMTRTCRSVISSRSRTTLPAGSPPRWRSPTASSSGQTRPGRSPS
jgi:hypothetical protein